MLIIAAFCTFLQENGSYKFFFFFNYRGVRCNSYGARLIHCDPEEEAPLNLAQINNEHQTRANPRKSPYPKQRELNTKTIP